MPYDVMVIRIESLFTELLTVVQWPRQWGEPGWIKDPTEWRLR